MAGRSATRRPGPAQALQHEEPAGEVGIDDDALAANLHEEAGVANKRDPEFSVRGESRLVSFTGARSDCGTTHQTSELGGALAKGRIAKRLLNHPATEPGGWIGSSLYSSIIVPIALRSRVIRAMRPILLIQL